MSAGLPDGTRVSEVALTVSDLEHARAFYEGRLGLRPERGTGPELRLGAPGDPFLRLVGDRDARPPGNAARMYHFAILYPSREDLARAVRRAVEGRWPLQGASDHLVSEAVYLADPERNGIELYRDRPPEEWPRSGGEIRMATLPLDLQALLDEAPDGAAAAAPPGTTLGHVHLHVRDIGETERFYREVVGLELTARYGGSASFLAAGRYHHHVGVNTWGMQGAGPAEEGRLGLRWFRLTVPDAQALDALAERLVSGGVALEREGGALWFSDPSGHQLVADVGR